MPSVAATRLNKNLLAGVMFVAFGLFGLWLARDLDGGAAGDMGPGYFPRLVCAVLIGLGGALAAAGLMRESEAPEGWAWRPLLLVTASALAFALLLRPFGLVGTLAVTIVLASAAGTLLRPLALALLVAVLIAANVGIFVIALKMPIPLWPSVF
jgi:putative tricarboxylic transport membrane protein